MNEEREEISLLNHDEVETALERAKRKMIEREEFLKKFKAGLLQKLPGKPWTPQHEASAKEFVNSFSDLIDHLIEGGDAADKGEAIEMVMRELEKRR